MANKFNNKMCTGDMEELTSNHSYDAFYVGENS